MLQTRQRHIHAMHLHARGQCLIRRVSKWSDWLIPVVTTIMSESKSHCNIILTPVESLTVFATQSLRQSQLTVRPKCDKWHWRTRGCRQRKWTGPFCGTTRVNHASQNLAIQRQTASTSREVRVSEINKLNDLPDAQSGRPHWAHHTAWQNQSNHSACPLNPSHRLIQCQGLTKKINGYTQTKNLFKPNHVRVVVPTRPLKKLNLSILNWIIHSNHGLVLIILWNILRAFFCYLAIAKVHSATPH